MSRNSDSRAYCNLCGKESDSDELTPHDFMGPYQIQGRTLPSRFRGRICRVCRDEAAAPTREHGTPDPPDGSAGAGH